MARPLMPAGRFFAEGQAMSRKLLWMLLLASVALPVPAAPADAGRGRACVGAAGEVQGVNCVPATLLERQCRREGEAAEGKEARCCEGLEAIPAGRLENGACRPAPPSVRICARCGDGACGAGEDPCNCPGDCPAR
jgi:hypothetical protein